MADIADILASITTGAEVAAKSLENLSEAKTEALKAGDYKLMMQVERLEKLTRKLTKAQEEEKEARETIIALQTKGVKLTAEENKQLAESMGVLKDLTDSQEALKGVQKQLIEQRKKATNTLIAQKKALVENWKAGTKTGKVFSVMTGGLAKLTAQVTAAI